MGRWGRCLGARAPMVELKSLLAFLRRDWRIRCHYRMGFVITLGQIVFTMAMFFFIAKLVDPHGLASLGAGAFGEGYFAFVALGLVGSQYLGASLFAVAGNLREEQLQGTLEAMLACPTRPWVMLLGSSALGLLWATLEAGLYLGCGVLVFGLDLARMNLAATLVLLVFTIAAMSSLGVLAASGVLLFKEFDPLNWFLGGLMRLVGGVYFPVALLPGWLQALAKLFPLTYAVDGLRQAALAGRSLGELWDVCVTLGLFAVVLWPVALAVFAWTIQRLKITGALSFR